MKKTKLYLNLTKKIFVVGIVSASLFGCAKEELSPLSPQSSIESSNLLVSNEEFEEQLTVNLEILEANQELEVTAVYDAEVIVKYDFVIRELEPGTPPPSVEKELCRGSGVSFVNCSKAAVDKHGCIKVTKDGSTYVASTCD